MNYKQLPIEGVYEIEPLRFGDARGYFCETYNARDFKEHTGLEVNWLQDNESMSQYGVVRGLHFQRGTHSQAKLVRVSQAECSTLWSTSGANLPLTDNMLQ